MPLQYSRGPFLHTIKERSLISIFRERLFHLVHIRHLSSSEIRKILKVDPQLTNLYNMSSSELQQILQINSDKMKLVLQEFSKVNVKKLLSLYKSRNIHYMTYFDSEYPYMLKEIYNPPLCLFYIGNKTLLERPALAVVGARDASLEAFHSINMILPGLIKENIVIVSGLAKGTDTIAHEGAIANGGKTIAILGGGFFHLYPSENKELANVIAREHLLLSEYPPLWKPEKWYFPMRNRIISGLSIGTLVIQAKKRSGSLITADMALESGREVFAIPGPITETLSEGTNHLIQQGAKLVTNSSDILEELQLDMF